MEKKSAFLKMSVMVLTFCSLLIAPIVLAKGGGGGGTVETPPPAEPTCSEDTWSCTSFSACGLDGTQTRVCTLVDDCSTTNTPKPAESQSCTPSCTKDTWTCGEFGACSNGTQTRTCNLTFDCPLTDDAKPSESQSCVSEQAPEEPEVTTTEVSNDVKTTEETPEPAVTSAPAVVNTKGSTCTEDIYECTDFSSCTENGRQTRSCVLKTDCPEVNTPKPVENQVCEGLQCGHLETLGERIECRLKLSKNQLAQEFEVLYFPEYCKTGKTDEWKKSCISLYRSFGTCWQKLPGSERISCAKNVLNISDFKTEKSQCDTQSGAAKSTCQKELVQKVKDYVLFNLYELSFKAEMLMSKGKVGLQDVVAIETVIENKKAELNTKTTVAEWKAVVNSMKAEWKTFTAKVN